MREGLGMSQNTSGLGEYSNSGRDPHPQLRVTAEEALEEEPDKKTTVGVTEHC